MKYKIISCTPIQHIHEIDIYKIGMIVQQGKNPPRGGNIYSKDKENLEKHKPGDTIDIEEIKETRNGNTIRIKTNFPTKIKTKNNYKSGNFTTKKSVNISNNGIEDPF